ncbi:hypothetical protein HY745_11975 [Candidatus Desantisbacteria bacterium]|nr:hypothetical protein [Candidatus Desantisbacteria bacterium]
MSLKQNCWEIKKCGREKSGIKAHLLGICPAASEVSSDGLNSGKNGGRLCWVIAGTLCDGIVQGSFAEKRLTCMTCEVFSKVKNEEGNNFILIKK